MGLFKRLLFMKKITCTFEYSFSKFFNSSPDLKKLLTLQNFVLLIQKVDDWKLDDLGRLLQQVALANRKLLTDKNFKLIVEVVDNRSTNGFEALLQFFCLNARKPLEEVNLELIFQNAAYVAAYPIKAVLTVLSKTKPDFPVSDHFNHIVCYAHFLVDSKVLSPSTCSLEQMVAALELYMSWIGDPSLNNQEILKNMAIPRPSSPVAAGIFAETEHFLSEKLLTPNVCSERKMK